MIYFLLVLVILVGAANLAAAAVLLTDRHRQAARAVRDRRIAELERDLLPALPSDESPALRMLRIIASVWLAERYRR